MLGGVRRCARRFGLDRHAATGFRAQDRPPKGHRAAKTCPRRGALTAKPAVDSIPTCVVRLKNQLSLSRAAPSADGRAKSKLQSEMKYPVRTCGYPSVLRFRRVLLSAWLFAVICLTTGRVSAQTDYSVLRGFGFGDQSGGYPYAGLMEGSDGTFYATSLNGGRFAAGTVYRVQKDGSGYLVLHHFGSSSVDGKQPRGGLVESIDGGLYGTTETGGTDGVGTVFRMNKDGTGYEILHHFSRTGGDGQNPMATLMEDDGGWLWGTTYNGGNGGKGTVFIFDAMRTYYGVMHDFASSGDGQNPLGGMIGATDGLMYGTTTKGGTSGRGTVFRMDIYGGSYAVLHNFTGASGDGSTPCSAVTEGSDGWLYGTTYGGNGTVYKMAKDGTGFALLRSFTFTLNQGVNPMAALIEGPDGALYGTCWTGYSINGTVFKIFKSGTGYKILHAFTGGLDGYGPDAGLIRASDGALYGTTQSGGFYLDGTIYKINTMGTAYSIQYEFYNSPGMDARQPKASLVFGSDGALYGTAYAGGSLGVGAVFGLTTNGSGYTLLHQFGAAGDGRSPGSALIEAPDGQLYGTTEAGGSGGLGTVFSLRKDGGGYAIIKDLVDAPNEGQAPKGPFLRDSDGWLYGVTASGGAAGQGTTFKVKTDGTVYTVLHHFGAANLDGTIPNGGLVWGSDGALYGTTYTGGASNLGTAFRIAKDGGGYAIVHHFGRVPGDAQNPQAGLVAASDGNLYGTTGAGGTANKGTIFGLRPDGSWYGVLHNFTGPDGQAPTGTLMESIDGLLYGTASAGSSLTVGTVFAASKDGSVFRTLWSFGSISPDGWSPASGLVETPDGTLFGTTSTGGAFKTGVVFRLFPPHPPSIRRLTWLAGTLRVQFWGLYGRQFQLKRSTDLVSWSVLGTFSTPPSGLYTFLDSAPPPGSAFYTVSQVP